MAADTETLWAVIVGAVLATVGGFAATQLERFLNRRERERSAALLFGEILSVIELITVLAHDSRGRGDPYGPFTMRLLGSVRREADAYDRNRESLFDLRDGKIRAQIHALMVRFSLTLEGVFDTAAEIAAAESELKAPGPIDPAKAARLEGLIETRQSAFDFLLETAAETKPIVAGLQKLAKQSFEAYATVVPRP